MKCKCIFPERTKRCGGSGLVYETKFVISVVFLAPYSYTPVLIAKKGNSHQPPENVSKNVVYQ